MTVTTKKAIKEPGISRFLSRLNLVDAIVVTGIALVSILIRSLSVQYPLSINEFDSWYLFYNALLIAHAGGNWYAVPPDVHSWYPYGFTVELGDTIGLPFMVALLALPFYHQFGANAVYTVTLFMYSALAALGVLAAYLAVSRLTNRIGGYFASLIVALSPSLTSKNVVGSLPKTSWGGVFVLLALFFLTKGIEEKRPVWGIGAGAMIFLADTTWGGNVYIDLSLAAAALLVIFTNRNSSETAGTFTVSAITSAFLGSFAPSSIGFESGLAHGLSLLFVSLLLYFDLYVRDSIAREIREAVPILIASAAVFLITVGVISIVLLGHTSILPSRYYAIINPFYQVTVSIDTTVAEYIPQPITQLFGEFGTSLILFVPGVYFLARKGGMAEMWLVTLGIVALYGTSAQPYLFNYTAYIVAAVAGAGIGFLVRRLTQGGAPAGMKRLSVTLFITLVITSLAADGAVAIGSSDTPTAILTSASPYPITSPAWVQALNWINNNTPQDAVIFSWWDYGYWIQVVGNRTVIDENNTLNSTQIKQMAMIFLNNESTSASIIENQFHLYPYGSAKYSRPVYIVAYDTYTITFNPKAPSSFAVYLGYPTDLGGRFVGLTTSFGDINKALGAMTVIAGYNQSDYINQTTITKMIGIINQTAAINQTIASEYANLLSASFTFAWTSRAYNSLIMDMFIEGLQSQGLSVVEPYTNGLFSVTNGTPVILPQVTLQYFQPVYIAETPLYSNPSLGYITGVIVVVYEFVQPGTVVSQ